MSRSRHQRGKRRKWGDHLRKNKEWKGDSTWKPRERPEVVEEPRQERRSPRTRLR